MTPSSVLPMVVVKVGGSLLDWPEFPRRLSDYVRSRIAERPLIVVGGGAVTDLIRKLDRIHGLGEERSHALALRSLDLTAHLLASLVPSLVVVEQIESFRPAWNAGQVPTLASRRFLEEVDAQSTDPLPQTWQVTSDSIAARLADHLGRAELVLLKSAPLPPGTDRPQAARLGLVDSVFPEAARRLERVVYLNLRDSGMVPVPLAP